MFIVNQILAMLQQIRKLNFLMPIVAEIYNRQLPFQPLVLIHKMNKSTTITTKILHAAAITLFIQMRELNHRITTYTT